MKAETLKTALGILCKVYPKIEFDAEVYWELLKDLPDEPFLRGVAATCKSVEQVFPGTNIAAILRTKTDEDMRNRPRRFQPISKMEPWSVPPPPEFYQLMEELKSGSAREQGR